MAKKKNGSKRSGKSAPKTRNPQPQARTSERDLERAQKSRRMGYAFLYALLTIVGLFCVYTLISTLFFPAKSVTDLRGNYLFISIIAIPYLLLGVAILVRKLRKKKREDASTQVRRAENLLFVVAIIGAFVMLGTQMLTGRTDVSKHKACTSVIKALQADGRTVAPEEEETAEAQAEGEEKEPEVIGFHSMLETMSIEQVLVCGKTRITLNYHEGDGIAGRFYRQAARDYAGQSSESSAENGVEMTVWPAGGGSRAALAAKKDSAVWILELEGPAEELTALLPLLQKAAPSALDN